VRERSDRANRLGRVWLKGVPGCRAVVFLTRPLPYERESAREGVTTWCPTIVRSCRSRSCYTRMESAGRHVDVPARTGENEQVDLDGQHTK